jgi:hypothetical protein
VEYYFHKCSTLIVVYTSAGHPDNEAADRTQQLAEEWDALVMDGEDPLLHRPFRVWLEDELKFISGGTYGAEQDTKAGLVLRAHAQGAGDGMKLIKLLPRCVVL